MEEITIEPIDFTPPGKPGTPVFSAVSPTTATATWTASTDNVAVTGYQISLNGAAPIPTTGLSHTFNGLKDSTTYRIEVRAIDAQGNLSDPSSASFDTPDGTPPSKPGTPVFSAVSPTTATATWTASTDNVAVTGYQISLDGAAPITTTELSHTFNGLKDSTTYRIEVRAIDAEGNLSDPSSASFDTPDVTPPSKPGTPAATDISYASATLQWSASTDNVAVTGYEVWLNASLLKTVTDTRYTATGLKDNTSYTFKIIAKDAAGNSSETALVMFTTKVDTTPPAKPTALVATNVSSRAAILTWSNTYDDLRVDHYEILSGDSVIAATETRTPAYLLTGLVAGTEYSLRVCALDTAGNRSAVSDPVVVKTPRLGAPKNARVTAVQSNTVKFEWDRPDDAIGLLGYHTVVRLPNGSDIKYNFPVRAITATPLGAAKRFQVSITAYDAAQIDSEPLTFEIATTGAVARPGTPKFLRLVRLEPDSAYFEWDAPDGPTRPDKYNITLKGPDGIQSAETVSANILFNGSYYDYIEYELSVTASNEAGNLLPTVIKFAGSIGRN